MSDSNFLTKLPKPFFALAPMDDVTDTVFRQIVADCAPPDLYFTEFVNVDGLQSPGRAKLLKKLQFTAKERPLIVQLWGLKPDNFYKTAREIVDGTLAKEFESLRTKDRDAMQGKSEAKNDAYNSVRGVSTGTFDTAVHSEHGGMTGLAGQQANAVLSYAGVDLNMGCPVRTVIKNGACAALMNNRVLAGEIIDATREGASSVKSDFPVSVKTRVGFTTVDESWIEFLLNKKLDLLSIHGRTVKQLSKTPADWDLIGRVREMRDSLAPSTLIAGNGDVLNLTKGRELAQKHQLDGIMIGRGIFHDPYIFADESPWQQMSKDERLALFAKHISLFAKTWPNGEYRFEALKKFAKVYINGFEGASDLRSWFMDVDTPEQALTILTT